MPPSYPHVTSRHPVRALRCLTRAGEQVNVLVKHGWPVARFAARPERGYEIVTEDDVVILDDVVEVEFVR